MDFTPDPGNSVFEEPGVEATMLVIERHEDGILEIDDPSRSMSDDERLGILIRAVWVELTCRWEDDEDD